MQTLEEGGEEVEKLASAFAEVWDTEKNGGRDWGSGSDDDGAEGLLEYEEVQEMRREIVRAGKEEKARNTRKLVYPCFL